ncbi:MAG TPA: nucleotidyltransferase family protein [Chloroflexota bacterium]|nr:nucleotidyltransferase family protein [Chloroflexota bacterium]
MTSRLPPVVLLAGGLATRLRPLTETIPKSLVDVAGEPFIYHQLRLLRSSGVERVVLCVGHLGTMIREAVADGARFGVEVTYSDDGPRPLGTAGAIRRALPLLDASFFTLYGDSYLPCDYARIARTFETSAGAALMTVFENDGRWDRSNVVFQGGRILAYDKRQPTAEMRHIDYGLGLFRKSVFEDLPTDQTVDLAAVYQDLLRRGQLVGCEVAERFYEIGSPSGLVETRRFLGAVDRNGERSLA